MSPGRSPRTASGDAPAYLVKGDDPALVAQAARALITKVVGDRDPSLVVEEYGSAVTDDLDVGAVVDACATPPFLVDRRVVVVRGAGRMVAADAARLAAVLADPLPSTVLVLVAGGGTIPQALVKAVTSAGEVIDTSVRTAGERKGWLSDQLHGAPVQLNAAAAARLSEHLGEDLGRLASITDALAAAYGEGATIDPAKLEPFLGVAGGVPSWDLTDAIDAGDPAAALSALDRMTVSGGLAPPQVIAILHRHYGTMLRLDGTGVRSGDEAAELLGLRSPFVARKALEQGARLGSEKVRDAVGLVATADLDVKGQTALPASLVLEVLVARLSRLSPARSARGSRGRAGSRGR